MAKNKVETFLNFCLRARKIVIGSGAIDFEKKGVYLIIVCSTGSENCFRLALKYKTRFSCPLMICKCGLENSIHRAGCKLAAIKDECLAKAIIANACEEYEIFAGGVD
ncbi:MAG: hypothetical protein ACI4L9_06715 [Candidatus Coproplasma sp.]